MSKAQTNKEIHHHHSFKTKSRFRLSFVNENTFNEVWVLKFTRKKVVFAVLLLVFAIVCMVSTILAFSPLRMLLPGYLKQSQRQENIVNSMKMDSLTTRVNISSAYINNLADILNGHADTLSTQQAPDSDMQVSPDSLLPASEAEKKFVRQFEEAERFNLTVLSPVDAEGVAFFTPVAGATVTTPNPDNSTIITLTVARNTPVTSIYEGTVIDCYSSPYNANTIIIQHSNGFISKYSGVTSPFVVRGDKVLTGTAIGLANDSSTDPKRSISFELWNKGTALDPIKYVPF
jgi:hypothetical protein